MKERRNDGGQEIQNLTAERVRKFYQGYSKIRGKSTLDEVLDVVNVLGERGVLYSGKVKELYEGEGPAYEEKKRIFVERLRGVKPPVPDDPTLPRKDTDILVTNQNFQEVSEELLSRFPDADMSLQVLSPSDLQDPPSLNNSAHLYRITLGEDTFEIKAGSDGVMGDFTLTPLVEDNVITHELSSGNVIHVSPCDTIIVKLLRNFERDIDDVAAIAASPMLTLDRKYIIQRAEEMGVLPRVLSQLRALDMLPPPVQSGEIASVSDQEVREYPSLNHIKVAEQNSVVEARRGEIRALVHDMIPPYLHEHVDPQVRILAEFATNVCTTALLTELHHYGDSNELGADYQADPRVKLPATYHNLEGSLYAILGVVMYMEWDKSIHEDKSEYNEPVTYLASVITAAWDDAKFSGERGTDEVSTGELAREYLLRKRAHPYLANWVRSGAEASQFDERTGKTKANMKDPLHRSTTTGDVLHMATSWSLLRVCALVVENMHRDFGGKGGPIAPEFERILFDKLSQLPEGATSPRTPAEMTAFIDNDEDLTRAAATSLIGNKYFLSRIHRFADSLFQELVQDDKEINGSLNALFGERMLPFDSRARVTFSQVWQIALDYARSHLDTSAISLPAHLRPVLHRLLEMSTAGLSGNSETKQ